MRARRAMGAASRLVVSVDLRRSDAARSADTGAAEVNSSRRRSSRGMSLIELVIAFTILMVLTTMALPMAKVVVKREKERLLRADLHELRDAIDRYKDAADRGLIQVKLGSEGYPPDLETLVKGVDINGKKYRFLRRIPMDPMTHSYDWGMRSISDDADSTSWGGNDVFDVYTTSDDTALDGTKYSTW
jgi:general secretion pathway protein G